jgi:hypothetical protein
MENIRPAHASASDAVLLRRVTAQLEARKVELRRKLLTPFNPSMGYTGQRPVVNAEPWSPPIGARARSAAVFVAPPNSLVRSFSGQNDRGSTRLTDSRRLLLVASPPQGESQDRVLAVRDKCAAPGA